MKSTPTIAIAATALLASTAAFAEQTQITSSADRAPSKGAAEFFTGDVTVNPYYAANEHTTSTGGLVDFTPGARSAWHTHPAGQVLIVTNGTGWVQEEGGTKRAIKSGDVIWTPPGVKHWHGAAASETMSHIAITNMKGGKNVDWMEQVTDEHYLD
jgi:quercetin dioxygenase-like cupin family protein